MNKDCSLPNNIFYDATFSVQKYRGMGKYINNFKEPTKNPALSYERGRCLTNTFDEKTN